MTRAALITLLLAVAVGVGVAATASAQSSRGTYCGEYAANYRYSKYIAVFRLRAPTVSCANAKRVMRTFLAGAKRECSSRSCQERSTHGWGCLFTQEFEVEQNGWYANCGRPHSRALINAFGGQHG